MASSVNLGPKLEATVDRYGLLPSLQGRGWGWVSPQAMR
jgi:hypothetical protein